jgi:glycosyltransferase involved in cell wall biosynthesis
MAFKLAIIANEFFDLGLGPGRMGGFGWAARQVSRLFADPSLDTTVVYFTGELIGAPPGEHTVVHGRPLILRQPTLRADFLRARSESPDLILMVDYRPSYRWICHALPTTPLIVWVRDPRPPDDVAKVASLRIPGTGDELPLSALQPDCSSLGSVALTSWRRRRPLGFASPAPHLRPKVEGMMGMAVDSFDLLPNPIDLDAGGVARSPHPRVAFLARLDPYKRPWLAVELARRFPTVEFLLAGKAHYHGARAWRPEDLPSNVRLLGHVDDREKSRLLASSWVLLNTSIHEGLAVSFLEALACRTPLLATVDPGGVVSRYGVFAGRSDGTGLAALPALEAGLRRLLSEPRLREVLGARGSTWVSSTHSRWRFLEALAALASRAGLRPPPGWCSMAPETFGSAVGEL